MADNKRWFKVWNTLLVDIVADSLSLEEIGRFVVLGCLMSSKGEKGKIELTESTLKTFLGCEKLPENFKKMFHIREDKLDNGKIIVSMKNWIKYQLDSTGYVRLKKHREKQKDNGLREEKIREDKDKTKKRIFIPPSVDEVKAYCFERKNGIDPQKFIDHYEANGWKRGNTAIKDWKACIRTWEAKRKEGNGGNPDVTEEIKRTNDEIRNTETLIRHGDPERKAYYQKKLAALEKQLIKLRA